MMAFNNATPAGRWSNSHQPAIRPPAEPQRPGRQKGPNPMRIQEDRSPGQEHALATAYLRLQIGRAFDPISAAQAIRQDYGVSIDWHVMSDVLEVLLSQHLAFRLTQRGPDGMAVYAIN
jgi:hypothetical protein